MGVYIYGDTIIAEMKPPNEVNDQRYYLRCTIPHNTPEQLEAILDALFPDLND
jgi:hypothetical protein